MLYKKKSFLHGSSQKIGVLLVNLGTPDEPTRSGLQRYLKVFLSDQRVVEQPKWLWWPILRFILLFRSGKSAKLYKSVWKQGDSPLRTYGNALAQKLQTELDQQYSETFLIKLGMNYGHPSIAEALEIIYHKDIRHLVVIPLFPQYSATTTASVFDHVARVLKQWRWIPSLRFLSDYHNHPDYIRAIVASLQPIHTAVTETTKLVFSFHGIPVGYFKNGDPYHCQCHKTARLVAEQLKLPDNRWMVTFQSRFGKKPWLQPYTDMTLQQLPQQGVEHVIVVCPGFANDCLETLEEIDEQNRQIFLKAGGKTFQYIPALNDTPDHVGLLRTIVEQESTHWLEKLSQENVPQKLQQQKTRADKLKEQLR